MTRRDVGTGAAKRPQPAERQLSEVCGSYWVDPLQNVVRLWFTGLHVNWGSPNREGPMPWRTPTVEDERACFVIEADISDLSHAELCGRHGISRPTGYKWMLRLKEEGLDGLQDRSHRPLVCPHSTLPATVARVLELRKRYSSGARTLRGKLARDPTIETVPSTETIARILKRNGCIESRKPRRRRTHFSANRSVSGAHTMRWSNRQVLSAPFSRAAKSASSPSRTGSSPSTSVPSAWGGSMRSTAASWI